MRYEFTLTKDEKGWFCVEWNAKIKPIRRSSKTRIRDSIFRAVDKANPGVTSFTLILEGKYG